MKKFIAIIVATTLIHLLSVRPAYAESITLVDKGLTQALKQHSYPLNFENQQFSGKAWDMLLHEAKASQFFLLGEEHGIAENPKLAADLFKALIPSGYSRFGIEVSPQMATLLDKTSLDGLEALTNLYKEPATRSAFFGMKEEAEMLAEIRQTMPNKEPVFWGFDYEVLGDRYLLSLLEAAPHPAEVAPALAKLRSHSNKSWLAYEETKNPQHIFSFAGNPELVKSVRLAWPSADDNTEWTLNSLEETLAINSLWSKGQGWESNEKRASLLRSNFLKYWHKAKNQPKVLVKMGATHVIRGRSMIDVFDLGALLPEVAAIHGGKTFHLLVLPGKSSATAMLNPTTMLYQTATQQWPGLEALLDSVPADKFTLIDMKPLRPLANRDKQKISSELLQVIYGFDAVLVMSGSTASANLVSVPASQ
jgi:hypothetical protein